MTTTKQNLTMWSGDTKTITVTVTDSGGNAVDLTSATISYVIKDGPSPSDSDQITKTVGSGVTITNAAGGIFTIALTPSDTASLAGVFYHEAEVTDSSSNVATVFTGAVTINEDGA